MPKGVYPRLEKHKQCGFQKGHKINLNKPSKLIGRKCSIAHIEKVRQKMIGRTCSLATRQKIAKAHLGMKPSEETLEKLRKSHLGQMPWNKGKRGIYSEETLRSMGNSEYHKRRKLNANYPTINAEIYASFDWKKTRIKVYARDNYICQECGVELTTKYGKRKICCHHIDYNIHNLNLNNLITLCYSCHAKTNYRRENWVMYFQNKIQRKKGRVKFC